jgi:hypothetical protein
MISFGFYDAVNGDREYNAVQMAELLNGVITEGVFENIGNKLNVVVGTGMNVSVRDGKAWFNSRWTVNDSNASLTITPSDLVLPRIDSVVLEMNASSGVRANSFKVIAGTPAATPIPPVLYDTSEILQVPLAYILVRAGTSSILTTDITNLVGTGYCPYVASALSSGGVGGAAILEIQVFS